MNVDPSMHHASISVNQRLVGSDDEVAARRQALIAQCLAGLGDRPQLQGRFQALLQVAQRYAVLREQQAASSPSAGPCCAAARCAWASCSRQKA
jgi:hypothetical protein